MAQENGSQNQILGSSILCQYSKEIKVFTWPKLNPVGKDEVSTLTGNPLPLLFNTKNFGTLYIKLIVLQ